MATRKNASSDSSSAEKIERETASRPRYVRAKVSVGSGYTALNIRSGASKDFDIVLTVPDGAEIEVGKTDGEWCPVKVGSVSGYTMSEFVERP